MTAAAAIAARRSPLSTASGYRRRTDRPRYRRCQIAGEPAECSAGVVILCRMAADLVPIRLGITGGDLYTLWAPRWRDAGDEWEAFLGKDEDLYAFTSAADLVAFVRTNTDNDLIDHPAWKKVTAGSAHKLD